MGGVHVCRVGEEALARPERPRRFLVEAEVGRVVGERIGSHLHADLGERRIDAAREGLREVVRPVDLIAVVGHHIAAGHVFAGVSNSVSGVTVPVCSAAPATTILKTEPGG